jgi:hypothetical protein
VLRSWTSVVLTDGGQPDLEMNNNGVVSLGGRNFLSDRRRSRSCQTGMEELSPHPSFRKNDYLLTSILSADHSFA